MHLSEFKILHVLAQELNMRKASERLYVSQPALSQRLQTIENSWGTKIFLRSQKGLAVTAAGEKIIAHVNAVIQDEERLREELESLSREIFGTLRLAVASIIGQYWLPQSLKKYVSLYPQVNVSLITGWSSEIIRHLYEDQIHIGIVRGNPEWRGEKIHLFSDSLYLVDTDISSIEELQSTDKPFIQFKSHSTYYQDIQEWWQDHFNVPPKKTIIVDQIETCKQMALHGIGYAILPSISLQSSDAFHKVPLFNRDGERMKRDTWMISQASSLELKQVEAFVKLVNNQSGNFGLNVH
ncbi:LysR family transcriptional regulator [Fictibacillus macauensis ZFHKF-1]|uniref:LysR family transcriptional regulator n=1 Tax=Fictibacillus macauensis ZFHKF-1 TaxID=1196324 RepID=I8IZS2_9BACL|nr:LysR family transcriptional regulator [Fictibacillus macauensis]EIT84966.1 LysR family transcriptional regulator [Fictibacillus macauensis ZFHKF-1]